MAKAKTVVLRDTANGVNREFDQDHAVRILQMKNNGGWVLPENSPYKFNQKDGIFEHVGNSKRSKSPEKGEGDRTGD